MKKNLFYAFALAALTLGGFGSCTNTEPIDDNGGGKQTGASEAYVSVSISIPNASSMTRDQEDSGDYETGTADEYKVNKLTLYFFNKFELDANGDPTAVPTDETTTCVLSRDITSFPNKQEDAAHNFVYTSVVTKLQTGIYRVYGIVNGNVTADNTTTEAAFKASLGNQATAFGSTVPTSGLFMASRTATGATSSLPYIEVEIKADNNENNPAPVIFSVERVVARVDVTKSSQDSYTLTSTDGTNTDYATVAVESFTVVNQSKDFHYFRQVGKFAEGDHTLVERTFGHLPASDGTNDYYILDPKTITKADITAETPATLAGYFNNPLNTAHTYTAVPDQAATDAAKLYTYENSLYKEQQVHGYSTGIIFKAKVTPLNLTYVEAGVAVKTDVEATINANLPDNFFFSAGRFYSTVEAMRLSGFDIQVSGSPLTDGALTTALTLAAGGNTTQLDAIKKVFDDLSIKFLQGGYCYYPHWIGHYGTGTQESVNKMQAMEFGIVRNNLYRVRVNGVKAIGLDDDGPYEKEDPDKTNEVYLLVTMSVKPWIVRDASIVLQ